MRSLRPTAVVLPALILSLVAATYAQEAEDADGIARRRTPTVAVFDACKQSVVNISSTHLVKSRSPIGSGRMFEDFFNWPGQQQRVRKYNSVGSGFVIHKDGYIVTNAHVVARTAERKVIFEDKQEYEAEIVAIDQELDLAVLKIKPDRELTPLRLGTSSDLMVGETTIAIGNPMGLQNTVTVGVVSALDRSIRVNQTTAFKGLIQTDASINPGNSGGPLLNVLGELIGVNSAIRGDAQNIGFAIPVDHLRRALPELLDVERRYRFKTGMRIGAVDRCHVLRVDGDSPADRAGVEVGDRVIQLNDRPIDCAIDYHIALIGLKGGDHVTMQLEREGEKIDAELTLEDRPRPDGGALLRERFGIVAESLTAELARQRGMPARIKGLLVTGIEPGSGAARARFRRGDIIHSLGRYAVADMDQAGELLETIQPGQRVSMYIMRISGRTIFQQHVVLEAR